MDQRTATVDGRLFYRSWGTVGSPVVLLLHGLSAFSYDWIRVATQLASTAYVVAPDLRGFGNSALAPDGAYGLADFAGDVVAIADALGAKRVSLVGHSLGGRIALYIAATRPMLVERLVLVDAVPEMNPDGSRAVRERLANAPASFASFEDAVAAFRPQLPALSDGALRARMREYLVEAPDGRFAVKRDPSFSSQMPGAYAAPAFLPDRTFWQLAQEVACPVMLVRGTRSTMVTPELAQRLHEENPRVSVTELDASHNVPADRPDALSALIANFCTTDRKEHLNAANG